MGYLLYHLALITLALPGVALIRATIRTQRWSATLLPGATLGLGLAIALSFALASGGWLGWFWYIWWPLAGVSLASLLWRRADTAPVIGPAPTDTPDWPWPPLLALLALVGLTRSLVWLGHDLPPGWDPSFHLILVDKVRAAQGLVGDWQPFGGHQLNYPLAPHVLLALLQQASGASSPQAFAWLLPVLGVLATGQVLRLAEALGLPRGAAFAGALSYGLLANYGSIEIIRWGGLPNALGMVFLMEAVILLVKPGGVGLASLWLGLLLAATTLAHHHVMLVAGLVVASLWLGTWRQPDWRARTVLIWRATAWALLLAGLHVVPYALRLASLGSTKVWRYEEILFTPAVIGRSLGWVFLALVIIGLCGLWRGPWPCHGRRDWCLMTGALAGCFGFFEYAYRCFTLWRYQHEYVAFTPSRFLMDLVPLLAVPAGYAAYWLAERLKWRTTVLAIAFAILMALNYPIWPPLLVRGITANELAAFAWIRQQTPPAACVLSNNPWAAWATWRRATSLPIPISEGPSPPDDFMTLYPDWLAGRRPMPADLLLFGVGPPGVFAKDLPRLWTAPDGQLEIRAISPAASAWQNNGQSAP